MGRRSDDIVRIGLGVGIGYLISRAVRRRQERLTHARIVTTFASWADSIISDAPEEADGSAVIPPIPMMASAFCAAQHYPADDIVIPSWVVSEQGLSIDVRPPLTLEQRAAALQARLRGVYCLLKRTHRPDETLWTLSENGQFMTDACAICGAPCRVRAREDHPCAAAAELAWRQVQAGRMVSAPENIA